MPKYTIKKGYENRVFPSDGIRRLSDNTLESDHELNSPYLESVSDAPAQPAAPAAPTTAQPQPVTTGSEQQ